jgi:BlaI family transcriptional regulator, penicillinase repressor
MGREAQDVTESELSLLQVLWDRGRCSTRQLTDVLYPEGGASGYATVQKLLERLEAKGLVSRDRSLFVHTFTAAADRDELIGRRIRAMADKLCGGSLAPIVSHLARNRGLTADEREALRALIEDESPATPDTSSEGRERKDR